MKVKYSTIAFSFALSLHNYDNVNGQEQNLRSAASRKLIVGGSDASGGEFPYIVTWHKKDLTSQPNCAGSLVAPNIVLTSASCFPSDGPLRVGSLYSRLPENSNIGYAGFPTTVKEKILHPDYNNDIRYDFLLLVLNDDVDTNQYPIVELNLEAQPSSGEALTMIGFGSQSRDSWEPSYRLKKVDMPNVNYDACVQTYNAIASDSLSPPRYYELNENFHLCTTGVDRDACYGDTGGPILKRVNGQLEQIGIISTGNGCVKTVGVYPRVSAASSWLFNEICIRASDPKPRLCDSFTDSPSASPMPTVTQPTNPPTKTPTRPPTPSPTKTPSRSPSDVPSASPTTTPSPTTSPTVCEGDICEDIPPLHFTGDFLNCNTADLTGNKCINNANWVKSKFCRLGCFRAGLGYEGDICCNANEDPGEYPTKSPTATPTLPSGEVEEENCTPCDNMPNPYMLTVGADCETSSLVRDKCSKNGTWRQEKWCRLSCYKRGNGYEGDKCCVFSDS